jgi:DNA ligase D-like protein (predicted polymerase)
MAPSDATTVEAGDRELRVSSPDRVIFPATERTPAVTKLDVVRYYLAVEDGIMRALRRRPTTLERWPKGVHPGMVLSTRDWSGGDAFFQKRIPRGAPDYVETARIQFPSGRHADEICPTEIAVVGWAAQMGTITFHPWPVRSDDVDHPDELRLDLDPQPGTDFADAVRAAAQARALLEELGYAGFPKTSGGRGVHIYVRIEPRWTFTDVRHAAIAFGRVLEERMPGEVTTKWWKEERGARIFVDYNQNARDRTIASAYSVRPKPGAPVSAPVSWDELPEIQPEDFTVATMPARFAAVGDHHAAIDDVAHSLQPLLDLYEAGAEARPALARPRPAAVSAGVSRSGGRGRGGRRRARARVARQLQRRQRRVRAELVTQPEAAGRHLERDRHKRRHTLQPRRRLVDPPPDRLTARRRLGGGQLLRDRLHVAARLLFERPDKLLVARTGVCRLRAGDHEIAGRQRRDEVVRVREPRRSAAREMVPDAARPALERDDPDRTVALRPRDRHADRRAHGRALHQLHRLGQRARLLQHRAHDDVHGEPARAGVAVAREEVDADRDAMRVDAQLREEPGLGEAGERCALVALHRPRHARGRKRGVEVPVLREHRAPAVLVDDGDRRALAAGDARHDAAAQQLGARVGGEQQRRRLIGARRDPFDLAREVGPKLLDGLRDLAPAVRDAGVVQADVLPEHASVDGNRVGDRRRKPRAERTPAIVWSGLGRGPGVHDTHCLIDASAPPPRPGFEKLPARCPPR